MRLIELWRTTPPRRCSFGAALGAMAVATAAAVTLLAGRSGPPADAR